MATAIASATISSDLKANPDQIWSAEALPNSTTKTSDEFLLGQTMGGVEVKVVVETAGTLTAALLIELQTSATTGTGYATSLSETIALGAITAGQELARFILPREVVGKLYTVLKLTTTDDETAMKIDAYPVIVS